MSIDEQARILEDAVLDMINGNATVTTNAIIKKYTDDLDLFYVPYPLAELDRLHNYRNWIPMNTDMVYVHVLYRRPIRILNPNNGWENVSNIESSIYAKIIYDERKQHDIELGDYIFRFVRGDLRVGRKHISRINNPRTLSDYKLCTTMSRSMLVDIMWNINISAPNINIQDRNTMIEYLSRFRNYDDLLTWNLNRITYYYQWFISRPSRWNLCDIIEQYVFHNGDIKDPGYD